MKLIDRLWARRRDNTGISVFGRQGERQDGATCVQNLRAYHERVHAGDLLTEVGLCRRERESIRRSCFWPFIVLIRFRQSQVPQRAKSDLKGCIHFCRY